MPYELMLVNILILDEAIESLDEVIQSLRGDDIFGYPEIYKKEIDELIKIRNKKEDELDELIIKVRKVNSYI